MRSVRIVRVVLIAFWNGTSAVFHQQWSGIATEMFVVSIQATIVATSADTDDEDENDDDPALFLPSSALLSAVWVSSVRSGFMSRYS